MPCQLCRERVKDWNGAAPKCAFESGRFDSDNWNCATANAIRDLMHQDNPDARPEEIAVNCGQDLWRATIDISNAEFPEIDDLEDPPSIVYVEWYKRRGRTDQMWVMTDPPQRPTEAQALALIEVFAQRVRTPIAPIAAGKRLH